jgi:hypothetical protein
MRTIAQVVAALVVLVAGPAQAIVGPSTPGSPLKASLVMLLNHRGATAGFCTAVVLAPTVLMTAAHCVPPGADLRVDLPDSGPTPTLLPVAAVARHPGYRADAIRTRERSVDLALLRLPAPLPAGFVPTMISAETGAEPGQPFLVSGYGLGRENEPRSSGMLRSATLAARDPSSAVLLWASDPTGGGAGACTGDSGAPVTRPEHAGVVALVVWSAGTGRHQCGDLTQALWLAPQRSWIDGVMAGWRSER